MDGGKRVLQRREIVREGGGRERERGERERKGGRERGKKREGRRVNCEGGALVKWLTE